MNITNLEITNFRKFSRFKIENLKKMNIIIGKNSIGKTSIIESIYFGSISKSFKTYYDNVLIKEGSKFLKVKISLDTDDILEIILDGKEKKAKINNNIVSKMSDYICKYSVVVFSPDDIKLMKDSPSVRRNYLNIEISNINKNYINFVNDYNKLIKTKNEYLKKLNLNENLDKCYLDILDEKIIEIGLKIYEIRNNYVNSINNYINKIFKKFRKLDEVYIKYESDFSNKTKEELRDILVKNRKKEIYLGVTSYGIHRDDIIFMHNNMNSESYSSQGIQKLILLSMKLSEISVLINDYNLNPILLLDDLFSELDENNQKKLLKMLPKDIQIFITTTDLNNIKLKDLKGINVIKLKEKYDETR